MNYDDKCLVGSFLTGLVFGVLVGMALVFAFHKCEKLEIDRTLNQIEQMIRKEHEGF